MSKIKLAGLLIIGIQLSLISTIMAAYSIQPGDTIEVQIINRKDLTTRQLISPDGTLSLPLVGRYQVQGKSLETVDTELTSEFEQYLKNPVVVIQIEQLKKPISNSADLFYISLVDSEKGTIEVKTAKNISEAIAWTAGKSFQAYRINDGGQKTLLKNDTKLIPGDFLVIDLVRTKPEPIYLAFYDQSKNLIDLKKANTVSEAMGWASGKSYQLVKSKVASGSVGIVDPGDTLIVTIGKADNWWEDNWYKILTGAAVVVGLFNSLK